MGTQKSPDPDWSRASNGESLLTILVRLFPAVIALFFLVKGFSGHLLMNFTITNQSSRSTYQCREIGER